MERACSSFAELTVEIRTSANRLMSRTWMTYLQEYGRTYRSSFRARAGICKLSGIRIHVLFPVALRILGGRASMRRRLHHLFAEKRTTLRQSWYSSISEYLVRSLTPHFSPTFNFPKRDPLDRTAASRHKRQIQLLRSIQVKGIEEDS